MKVPSWPPWEVTSSRQRLADLSSIIVSAKDLDPEVLGWMSRMLVVRSSGFVERTANEVFRSFIEQKSGGLVKTFALSWLERSRNPSPENILDMLGRFDATMQAQFIEFIDSDDQRIRRELALLVDRRNRIAHGLNEGIGREKALALKDVAFEVSDWLIQSFSPGR